MIGEQLKMLSYVDTLAINLRSVDATGTEAVDTANHAT